MEGLSGEARCDTAGTARLTLGREPLMRRLRTVEEYVEHVRQAITEVEELRSCLEYDLEELDRFPVFLDPLESGVRALYRDMLDGTYQWGREDLAFMVLARKHEEEIPFIQLLEIINETHRRGLEVTADE